MDRTTLYALSIVAYFVLMIGISLYLKRRVSNTMESYGKASGTFGSWAIGIATVGAWVGSGGLLGLTAYSYAGGLSQFWSYAIAYLSLLPFALFFVKRIRKMNLYTIPDFFSLRYPKYNEIVRIPTGILFSVRNATVLAMQLNGLAFMFTSFFGISHAIGVVVSTAVLIIYISISGYLSVMVTSIIQSILQTITPFIALGIVFSLVGGWDGIKSFYDDAGEEHMYSIIGGDSIGGFLITFFLIYISVGIFNLMADQSDWQRVVAAKTPKEAYRGFLIGVFVASPILLTPCVVGLGAKIILGPDVESNLVFYEVIKLASPLVATLLILGVLSTLLSCTAGYLFAGAMNISNDVIIYYKERNGMVASDKEKILYTRASIVITAILAIFFALGVGGIIELFYAGLAIITGGLIVPYLFAWFSKSMNTEGALAGMILGGSTGAIWTFLGNPYGIEGALVGIPVSLVACLVVRAMTKAPNPEDVEKTYYWGKQFQEFKNKSIEQEK